MIEVITRPQSVALPPIHSAVLACEGACTINRSDGARVRGVFQPTYLRPIVTRHLFIRIAPAANAQAVIYACADCGTERRYGLMGASGDAEPDPDELD